MIVDNLTELIGNTPMLRLNRLAAGLNVEILAKLEMYNPYSLKDRPALYMIDEDKIQKYAAFMKWPRIDLGCPTAGSSKRVDVKKMLKQLYRTNKKIKGNIFHALQNVKPEYLP